MPAEPVGAVLTPECFGDSVGTVVSAAVTGKKRYPFRGVFFLVCVSLMAR